MAIIKKEKEVKDKDATENATQEEVKKEVIVEEVEEIKVPKKKTRSQFDRNEMVTCKCMVKGGLIYKSKKNIGSDTTWDDYGSEEDLDIGEIMTIKASVPRFLTEPWFKIMNNDDLVEYLGLTKMYNAILAVEDIDIVFSKKPEAIQKLLQEVPKGMKELIVDRAKQLIVEKNLYDLRVINTLEKELKVDLKIFIEE